MGAKGLVWSAASMGILLAEGIGDTVRVSLTPRPNGDRREEVYAACELLQSLGLRTFAPSVTACPGCGRTTSTTFQELAESIQGYIRDKMPEWKRHYEGVEELKLAVMGCIVNGPGESKAANIGISLPGTGETPRCPVYIDGQKFTTLEGNYDELSARFSGARKRLHRDEISQARNPAPHLGHFRLWRPRHHHEALAPRHRLDLRDCREGRVLLRAGFARRISLSSCHTGAGNLVSCFALSQAACDKINAVLQADGDGYLQLRFAALMATLPRQAHRCVPPSRRAIGSADSGASSPRSSKQASTTTR